MSLDYEWTPAAPKLPKAGLAQVVEAVLPVLIWRAPVIKVVIHGLSMVERFVIEAALELGDITAEDIAEVTGLPLDVATRVIAHVEAVGVLIPAANPSDTDRNTYQPVVKAATDTLGSEELREYHRAMLTLLYLPATEELMAFDPAPGRPEPPMVHRVTPLYEAPMMPAELAGSETAAFLADRISAGTVLDLPDWVHGAEPDNTRLPETCPAYRCRGHLKAGGNRPTSVLTLVDAKKPTKTVPCHLPRADRLTARLVTLSESLTGALGRWGEQSTTPTRISSGGRIAWRLPLSAAPARLMIDEGISLSRQLGLRVLDQEATLAVAAELTPLDEEARALFALDHAVGHLLAVPPQRLSPHNLHAAVEDAKAEFGHDVATDDVRGELWRRGHFVRVYSLREADDFPYD